MTTDGSTGRRDGFNRWVASMKTDQPMETKAAPVKPAVGKLELELDDNATHVHRIPKELISRMREREQAPAPPPPQANDDDDDDESRFSPLGMVQEDRTAVFRPPPELLARAKRLKAPPKPDAQASVPTKPPPPGFGDSLQSMPASPKVPAFESVPAAAKGGFASVPLKTPLTPSAPARAAMPVAARAEAPMPAVQKASAAAHVVDFTEPVAEHAGAPASAPAPDSSAVFAKREPASGVLQVAPEPVAPAVDEDESDEPATREYSLPELGIGEPRHRAESAALAEPPSPFDEFVEPPAAAAESESPFAFEPSSVVPIVPPAVDVAGPEPLEAAPEAEEPPTTHAPVVVAEASAPVEQRSSGVARVMLLVVAALAAAALAWWRTRHF